MTPETEALLQKWLKMEIAKTKWSLVSKVIVILFLALSVFLSARLVEPIITRQLNILNAIQGSFLKNNSKLDNPDLENAQSLFDVFQNELTPEQKQQMQKLFNK